MTLAQWQFIVDAFAAAYHRGAAATLDLGDEVRLPRALFLELLKRPPSESAQTAAVLIVMVERLEAEAAAGRDVPDLASLRAARDDVRAEFSRGDGEELCERRVVH